MRQVREMGRKARQGRHEADNEKEGVKEGERKGWHKIMRTD